MNVAIVVAAGKGTRLGGDRPKQFLELGHIPIIIHTLRQFERSEEIDEVVVVLPTTHLTSFDSIATKFVVRKISRVVSGGPTRAQSVLNGLNSVAAAEVIAVHDGVRPFVTADEIDQVTRAANAHGAAILVAPVADTIKEVKEGRIVGTLARESLRRALTPQCFRFEILKRAYEELRELEAVNVEVTDDCYLVERLGVEIATVEGSARNIKITTEDDLIQAASLLSV